MRRPRSARGPALLLLVLAMPAFADRAGRWELGLQGIASGSESVAGQNGSSVDLDADFGLGASLGYHFDERLSVRFGLSWLSPDYDAVFATEEEGLVEVSHEARIFTGQLDAVWHFLDGPFTPFVEGGIGWTYVDSNIADGDPVTGCWWDPWWGYICRSFYSTYADTQFSWGVGAGLRYDFSGGPYVRGSVRRTVLDSNTDGVEPELDAFVLEVGFPIGY